MRSLGPLAVVLVAGLVTVGLSPVALADQPPSPSGCIKAWQGDRDYIGEGWPDKVVATAISKKGTTYSLRCGMELYGIVHTAGGTGGGHPIKESGADDADVISCFRRIISLGEEDEESDDGRVRFRFNYGPSGGQAGAWTDPKGQVYTMFTNLGSQGNDWMGCAKQ